MPTNTTNVTAGNDPLTSNFTNLMKGTEYEATIVAHNVRGAGASTDILSVMTAVDRKYLQQHVCCKDISQLNL